MFKTFKKIPVKTVTRIAFLFGGLFMLNQMCHAAGSGDLDLGSGIEEGAKAIGDQVKSILKLLYVVCGVLGLISAISVYNAFSNNDPDTRKRAAAWVGALIFVVVAVLVIKSVFLAGVA